MQTSIVQAFVAGVALVFALGACHHQGTTDAGTALGADDAGSAVPPTVTEIAITVDGEGYHPEEIKAPAGQPARLKFTRVSDGGCGQQVLFPSLKLQRDLPLDREVVVDITMPASGRLEFTCGMGMLRGTLVVSPH